MKSNRVLKRVGLVLWTAVSLSICGEHHVQAQKIDLNANGASDIWEIKFGAQGLNPNADTDGDKVSNHLESIAATSPFDSNSVPRILSVIASGPNVSIGLWSIWGKQYQLQSASNLAGGLNWATVSTQIARTGTVINLTAPKSQTARFFRVAIADVDSDGDGVNDWEEYQMGLDPLNAASNGQLDGNGQVMGDLAFATGRLAFQNQVTIVASDPTAVQPDPGQVATSLGNFTITRGGFPLNEITVNLNLGGPGTGFAVEGLDHAALQRPVTFPAGVSSVQVPVSPLANTNRKSPVIAMMKELPGAGYTVGASSNASVVIYPSPTPAGTGLTGEYFNNASTSYSNAQNFSGLVMTRVDPKVDFYWGGTVNAAVNRDNYSASWEGRLVTTTSGNYRFDIQADDGARLYVNNQLVLDAWAPGSASSPTQSVAIALNGGTNYPIRVEYYEQTNASLIRLRWRPPTAGSFANIPNNNVLRPTNSASGWFASYYNNTTLSGTPVFTQFENAVSYDWSVGSPADPAIAPQTYSVRWTGQVQPQYSEPYVFVMRSDDGSRLWVNNQLIIDDWRSKSASDVSSQVINLQGGVRYDLKLEYLQNTSFAEARLSWYSPSQPKQIIPTSRLYPASVPAAPSAVTSPLTAVGFLGQPFSFSVTGANGPLGYTAAGLPPGLNFNPTNGLISGVPSLAGQFQASLTSSNALGAGASVVHITIFNTGSALTRDVWNGVPGTAISDIPLGTPPNSSTALGALEGINNYGDNYAERVHGYFIAPVTANYYFWIAGSDAAELWISNDHEPVNKVKRAWTTGGTGPRQWTLQPKQKTPWLSLVAGQSYYIEVLHKAGVGTNDNWSVGWRQDPTGTNNTPAGLVPAHLLARHFDLPPSLIPGTLYVANMLAQAGAISSGVGSATLRVNAEGTQAILKYNYSGLSGPIVAQHIHTDPYLQHPSTIVFDLDTATPQPDGSLVWDIVPAGTLSAADIRDLILAGKTYINLHTPMYPAGEINGHFTPAVGSQTFTPPPPEPAWTDDHSNSNAAARFLLQATFGPSPAEIAAVRSMGYLAWISNQFALPPTYHLPTVLATVNPDPTTTYSGNQTFNAWWRHSITAPDQLRQRVAFALSEILVVSEDGVLDENPRALSDYYDVLLDHAFGNFRELLEAVTLSPAMGLYLDMRRNEKGDIITGRHPNENYAREILQLFSIGLNRMWPDGTLVMDSQGNLVPTYTQEEILGFSRVFTGWDYYQSLQGNGRLPANFTGTANYTNPMVLVPSRHEMGTKRILDNVIMPAAQGLAASSANVEFDLYGLNDLEVALDSIFHNENVGPFICRQLIQRLVTSHPSRDYLFRVVQKFDDNGAGVRGDMKAVIQAILMDYEARASAMIIVPTYGKQREPLLRVTALSRAFPAPAGYTGTYSQNNSATVTVTTTTPHRLSGNNDDVICGFVDTSGKPPPASQAYNNVTVTGPNTFTFTAPGIAAGTYNQTASTIRVTNSNHGIVAGNSVYLAFTTGGASNGVYSVGTVPSTSTFTVTAPDSASRNGAVFFPKLTGGGFIVQQGTNVTFQTTVPHGLQAGDSVYVNFTVAGSPADGVYQVAAVPDLKRFIVVVSPTGNQSQNGATILPLIPPPLVRSGNATVGFSTYVMNNTDGNGAATSALSQTPLNSPTVFNFFFPDYKFPGALASAGLTTPEFQLTSDTSVILQMNFLQAGVLGTSGNTNGLISFNNGNGAIMLDIGPWMTPAYTSNAGMPALVEALDSLLCAGQLSAAAKSRIAGFVGNNSNFAYGTPPTATQMRDRVRAVVHLITTSPDFNIQK